MVEMKPVSDGKWLHIKMVIIFALLILAYIFGFVIHAARPMALWEHPHGFFACMLLGPFFGMLPIWTSLGIDQNRIIFPVLAFGVYPLYLALMTAFLRSKTARTSLILFILFVALLFLNVAGCSSMIKGVSSMPM